MTECPNLEAVSEISGLYGTYVTVLLYCVTVPTLAYIWYRTGTSMAYGTYGTIESKLGILRLQAPLH